MSMDVANLISSSAPSLIKDNVAAQFRDMIITGNLIPGAAIVEGKWATKLNVAQASIRAALNILEGEGFVERSNARSARVTLIDQADIVHNFQVRTALEALSARLVAEHKYDLSDLYQIVADMRSAVDCNNLKAFYERDLRFHLTLCRLSGNPVLEQMLKRLLLPLFAFVVMRAHDQMDDTTRWLGSIDKHKQILDAISTGDPEHAAQVVTQVVSYFSGDMSELTLLKSQQAN